MSFKVAVRQLPEPIEVELGQTILDAALEKDLGFPNSCRSGNCGACKCRLHEGEVEMGQYSEFALSPEEKESGLILGCRAVPWSDCEISWLGEDELITHPHRIMDCEVTAVEEATHDTKIIRLNILRGGPYTFTAGQYAELHFNGMPSRQYSMANTPSTEELEFHVRRVPDGQVSSYVVDQLEAGVQLKVRGPDGTAYYREKHEGPILAIAGGSGLAPIKSIVESALEAGRSTPIHCYFGVRAERDLYLEEHFNALAEKYENFSFTPVLSEPDGPTERRTGFVTDAVKQDFGSLEGFKVYLCGPPPMVEAAQRMAADFGLPGEDIHADAFYTEADIKAQTPKG